MVVRQFTLLRILQLLQHLIHSVKLLSMLLSVVEEAVVLKKTARDLEVAVLVPIEREQHQLAAVKILQYKLVLEVLVVILVVVQIQIVI